MTTVRRRALHRARVRRGRACATLTVARAPADENGIAIAVAGGIPLLIGLLQSPVAKVQEAAGGALWVISGNGSFASICSIAAAGVVVLT